MKLINLKIKDFKNLTGPDGWFEINFENKDGITVLVGNNGSGKSNVIEAISAIFAGLYNNDKKFDFEFRLKYSIKVLSGGLGTSSFGSTALGSSVESEEKITISYIKKNFSATRVDELPSKIIASYSGEETRLFENYFLPAEREYDKQIKKTTKSGFKNNLLYIDKRDWKKIILVLAIYDFEYLKKNVGIVNIKNIKIEFNIKKLEKYKKNPNTTTAFIEKLNQEKEDKVEYKISDFEKVFLDYRITESGSRIATENKHKRLLESSVTKKEFYSNLTLAEDFNLIKDIEINFSNKEDSSSLSEGEKKQILIYFILNTLADKNSIILLDEPDSYIHVGNKERLKETFKKFGEKYSGEGEIVLTTHSPTLMHSFDENHLEYLKNGKINKEGKRGILDKITGGKMTCTETEIFLNSKKPVLLVTEGKTDIKHIKLAAQKLDFDLEFDIFSAGSAGKLKDFLNGLPNNMFEDKIIIGIFDYDMAGLQQLKNVGEVVEKNKISKIKKVQNRDNENIYGISLPCPNNDLEKHENCPIEFLYKIEKITKIISKRTLGDANKKFSDVEKLNQKQLDKKTELCFFKISESEISKNDFVNSLNDFKKEDFEGFRALFDLILEIKDEHNDVVEEAHGIPQKAIQTKIIKQKDDNINKLFKKLSGKSLEKDFFISSKEHDEFGFRIFVDNLGLYSIEILFNRTNGVYYIKGEELENIFYSLIDFGERVENINYIRGDKLGIRLKAHYSDVEEKKEMELIIKKVIKESFYDFAKVPKSSELLIETYDASVHPTEPVWEF